MVKGSGWRQQRARRIEAVLGAVETLTSQLAQAPPRIDGPRPGWGRPTRQERAMIDAGLNPKPVPRASRSSKPGRDE